MTWRRCADTLFRTAPDGTLVISLQGGDPVFLAAPGDAVWALLDEDRTLDELVAELARRFAAPADDVARDCRSLLDDLVRRGLVMGAP